MHKDQTESEEKYLTLNLQFDLKTSQLPLYAIILLIMNFQHLSLFHSQINIYSH